MFLRAANKREGTPVTGISRCACTTRQGIVVDAKPTNQPTNRLCAEEPLAGNLTSNREPWFSFETQPIQKNAHAKTSGDPRMRLESPRWSWQCLVRTEINAKKRGTGPEHPHKNRTSCVRVPQKTRASQTQRSTPLQCNSRQEPKYPVSLERLPPHLSPKPSVLDPVSKSHCCLRDPSPGGSARSAQQCSLPHNAPTCSL